MKYYLIAGEASGDLHASNLMLQLRKLDPSAQFRCWGGNLMQDQGGELVKHYRDLAFMGFAEVVANLGSILRNLKLCKQDILEYQPDALILIDYPGFNLRIARFAKKAGLRVFYYISPQVWAWKKSRVLTICKFVDHMFVILPFEKDFYARYEYDVVFVGHPLLDMIAGLPSNNPDLFRSEHDLNDRPIVALLPGSRKQEIRKMLPLMLSVASRLTEYQVLVAGAPSLDRSFYEPIIAQSPVKLIEGQTHRLLQNSYAALVTSGTATLETALFRVPEVVCYKGSPISYAIARRVIDRSVIRYISLVNLIMDREVVRELIQHDFNATNLENNLRRILEDRKVRTQMLFDFGLLAEKLGGPGASEKTARQILNDLKSNGYPHPR